jgi:hypothetical protein
MQTTTVAIQVSSCLEYQSEDKQLLLHFKQIFHPLLRCACFPVVIPYTTKLSSSPLVKLCSRNSPTTERVGLRSREAMLVTAAAVRSSVVRPGGAV